MRYSREEHSLGRFIQRQIADEQNSVELCSERRDLRCVGSDNEKKQGIGHGEIRCYSAPSGMTDYLRGRGRFCSARENPEVFVLVDFVENFLERCAEYEAVVNPVSVVARYERLNRRELADEVADYDAAVRGLPTSEADSKVRRLY